MFGGISHRIPFVEKRKNLVCVCVSKHRIRHFIRWFSLIHPPTPFHPGHPRPSSLYPRRRFKHARYPLFASTLGHICALRAQTPFKCIFSVPFLSGPSPHPFSPSSFKPPSQRAACMKLRGLSDALFLVALRWPSNPIVRPTQFNWEN